MKKIVNVLKDGMSEFNNYNDTNYTENELREIIEEWNEKNGCSVSYYAIKDGDTIELNTFPSATSRVINYVSTMHTQFYDRKGYNKNVTQYALDYMMSLVGQINDDRDFEDYLSELYDMITQDTSIEDSQLLDYYNQLFYVSNGRPFDNALEESETYVHRTLEDMLWFELREELYTIWEHISERFD